MKDRDKVIALLEGGDWEAAHEIVQQDSSSHGRWAHGIVHLMEGDLDNAAYWYRRIDRERPGAEAIAQEIQALRDATAPG